MRERDYQAALIRRLKLRFEGCIVLKNDPNYIQGFPDLLVLHEDKWAALEVKVSANASKQPNQTHYVGKLDSMSFASFVYPENEEQVLNAMERSFEA